MFERLSKLEPPPLIPVMRMSKIYNYKQASYARRKTIKTAKRQYKDKIEAQFTTSNDRDMWQGLHNITDYKDRKHPATNTATSLPDELNAFYARFEVSGSSPT